MKSRTMKLAIGMICALTMGASVLTLASCGESEEDAKAAKVMNVSLNPEVEFVLDSDDKVLAVNALNEEGNLIISAEEFENVEGKSATEAAELFVQVSKETGFLVTGNVTAAGVTNEVSISVSGEEAEALYNDVKAQMETYFSEENITAQVAEIKAITEAELEKLVAECAPYLEEAEIEAMEYEQLVETLAQSRTETAEFYSQELKNAYYEAKAFAMEQAELETLKSQLNTVAQAAISAANDAYLGLVESVEQIRFDNLVKEDSIYQKALKSFREAKTEYLNYRNHVAQMEQTEVTTAVTEQLAQFQTVVDESEAALLKAGEDANKLLDETKISLRSAYDTVIGIIETFSVKASEHVDAISAAQKQALEQASATFEAEYGGFAAQAKTDWNAIQAELNAGYAEETPEE